MGQGLSCSTTHEKVFFIAVESGDFATVKSMVETEPTHLNRTTIFHQLSVLHIAAARGHINILSLILDQEGVHPDHLNRHRQTPLMLAAMHGNIDCLEKLIEAGANILMFDSLHGRTCLHYAAYYGHSDCLQFILSCAHATPIADTWGFARFVNVRDDNGATPLHLAARQRRPNCVHVLLDSGALACASTGRYGFSGSTPLHMAARGGCLDSIRELLTWGADRLQRDSSGRIPYSVALKYNHRACAALLNPTSSEPLVWPSPLKFISELDPDAKALLERALMIANREREKTILKGTGYSLPSSPLHSDSGFDDDNISEVSYTEVCCICFDQVCTIQVENCGHQMCAHCSLALCCHNKPNPNTMISLSPVCPFCRSKITGLIVPKIKDCENDFENSSISTSRSMNFNEGSSSFKGLSSSVTSFIKVTTLEDSRIINDEDEGQMNKFS